MGHAVNFGKHSQSASHTPSKGAQVIDSLCVLNAHPNCKEEDHGSVNLLLLYVSEWFRSFFKKITKK